MTVRIVTDSTCDLPEETVKALGVTVIPMLIQVGSQSYQDHLDMTRAEFYSRVIDSEPYPTTAPPEAEVFQSTYERLVEQGAEQILSIHISSSLSAACELAQKAASQARLAQVKVFDSRQVSQGMGFQVEMAARLAEKGFSIGDIQAALEDVIPRIHLVAILDMFEYLQRSGRLSAAMAGLGKLLRFKPYIHIYDGQTTAESVRAHEGAMNRLMRAMTDLGSIEKLALIHTNAPERAEELKRRASDLLPPGKTDIVDITPLIGVHTGPGAVGFVCIQAKT